MTEFCESDWIAAIHGSPCRGIFVFTGGGSGALARLLACPGASRTVLEAVVPYALTAQEAFLNATPESSCSPEAAGQFAAKAWERALRFDGTCDPEVFGCALTATLATSRPHRGEHRAYLVCHTAVRTREYALFLQKGAASRIQEEDHVADWALRVLGDCCGLACPGDPPPRPDRELVAPEAWRRVLTGEWPYVYIQKDAESGELALREELPNDVVGVFPGSFHPFHVGHAGMLRQAQERLGGRVALELAVRNADKPPLNYLEIQTRLAGIFDFPGNAGVGVLLTGLPFFTQKARAFPGRTFIVGTDTILRVGDPAYHHHSDELLRESHGILAGAGARFLVFWRKCDPGVEDVPALVESLRRICVFVPQSEFREDICSTALRRGQVACQEGLRVPPGHFFDKY